MRVSALENRLARLPMLRAFVPFAAGIVLAEYYLLPAPAVWAGFFLCGVLALAARSSLYTAAALICFGWGMAQTRTLPPDPVPRGIRTEFAVTPRDGGTALITAWHDKRSGQWYDADLSITLRTDSALALRAGEKLVVRGYLNDFRDDSYGRLMRRRGYAGSMWLAPYSILVRSTDTPARTLHGAATERLCRLGLPAQEHALSAAMTTGERSGITQEMRRVYARSGTSHLLAVSGLHVGIVFLLVNFVLGWLPLLRHGQLMRNAGAIGLIWLYAATTGLSPSVVRAALMFSALQLSLASGSTYVSGNVLAGTALLMLLFRPTYLFDISFQLSFLAVAAILAWGVPLSRALRTRYKAVNLLTASLAIGLTASAATSPLVAHTFGIVPLAGIALNPLVIPLAGVTVLASIVWILLPLPVLAPLFRLVAGTSARWLNTAAEQTASLPGGAFEWSPSALVTGILYAIMALLTLTAWSHEAKKPLPLAP